MHQYVLELLKQLEAAIPPTEGTHHALVYTRIGSEADGFQDKLVLWINHNGVQSPYYLDVNDAAIMATMVTKTATDVINLQKQNEAAAEPAPEPLPVPAAAKRKSKKSTRIQPRRR